MTSLQSVTSDRQLFICFGLGFFFPPSLEISPLLFSCSPELPQGCPNPPLALVGENFSLLQEKPYNDLRQGDVSKNTGSRAGPAGVWGFRGSGAKTETTWCRCGDPDRSIPPSGAQHHRPREVPELPMCYSAASAAEEEMIDIVISV